MLKSITNRIKKLSLLIVASLGNLIINPRAIAQYAQYNYNPQDNYNYYPNSGNQQQYPSQNFSNFDQNLTRYIVYIDSENYQVLERIRNIEPTAYFRLYNGRRVIQSGVFVRPDNAQQRVRELEFNGITGGRILQVSTNQENSSYIPQNNQNYNQNYNQQNYNQPNYNQQNYNNSNNRNRYQQSYYEPNNQQTNYQSPKRNSRAYYIVIPSDANKMRSLGEEIVQKIGNNATVYLKTQPYGPHIAIGPFAEKSEAQLWNNYIKKIGYNDARIYYGK